MTPHYGQAWDGHPLLPGILLPERSSPNMVTPEPMPSKAHLQSGGRTKLYFCGGRYPILCVFGVWVEMCPVQRTELAFHPASEEARVRSRRC